MKITVQFTFSSFFDDNSKMFHSSTRISLSTFETMTFSLKIMTQTLQKTLKWLLLAIGDSKKRLEERTSKEDAKFDVVARIFEEVFFVNSTKKCILICLVSNLSCTEPTHKSHFYLTHLRKKPHHQQEDFSLKR